MRKLYLSLTTSGSIDNTIRELERYKVELNNKAEIFVSRLIEIGIQTARSNGGRYKDYIRFTKTVMNDEYGITGLLIATDGVTLIREWYTDATHKHKRSYEVSPLLLAEFGSGWLAEVLDNVPGVGQGTMPNSYGHATDDDGWYWYDYQGIKHHSIGEAPTYPIHTAFASMEFEIERIAREVFRG